MAELLPLEIIEYFDVKLLNKPARIGDNLEKIDYIFQYLQRKFADKNMSRQKLEKMNMLIEEYKKLYVTAKKKEDSKTKIYNKTKGPLYFIQYPEHRFKTIYKGLRHGKSYGWNTSKAKPNHSF